MPMAWLDMRRHPCLFVCSIISWVEVVWDRSFLVALKKLLYATTQKLSDFLNVHVCMWLGLASLNTALTGDVRRDETNRSSIVKRKQALFFFYSETWETELEQIWKRDLLLFTHRANNLINSSTSGRELGAGSLISCFFPRGINKRLTNETTKM